MTSVWKRLASGLSVLAVAAATVTSVMAYNPATDVQSSTSNVGPNNTGFSSPQTTVAPNGIVSQTATYNFTAGSPAAGQFGGGGTSAPAATAANLLVSSSATTIGTMYQRWIHATSNEWFYIYARQSASSAPPQNGTPSFNYFYYTKNRGAVQVAASGANGVQTVGVTSVPAGGTGAVAQTGVGASQAIIYNDAGNVAPIMTIINMVANVPACSSNVTPGQTGVCSATFTAALRWGLPQYVFTNGTVNVSQAVESVAINGVVYYDAWENAVSVAFTDTAPTQSATGVTNATGTRSTGVAYPMTQVIGDANGDELRGQLIFVITSGAEAGQWFTVGYITTNDKNNTVTDAPGTLFYESWNETIRYSGASAAGLAGGIVGNYATVRTTTVTSGATSISIDYEITFSTLSRGAVNVWGRAEDYHGLTSGNVDLTGSLTIQ